MNTNLLVRKGTFLAAIKRTYVQLSAVFLIFLLAVSHQVYADDQVVLVITDPLPVCSPATVDLTLPEVTAGSTPGLNYSYYYDFGMTQPIPDPAHVGTGTYYIVGRRPIPPGIAELQVHVVVDPASVGGTVSGGSAQCINSTSGLLTLSGQVGAVVKWQSSVSPFSTWTDIANTSTTYTSGALTETTQFRAIVQSGSCGQSTSSATTVTISPATVGGTVTGGSSVCTGSTSGLLTLSGNVGTVVKWQSSVSPFSAWTDIANTLTTYISGVLTETTQFRAVVQSGSCPTANSSSATVTVDPASVGGTVSGGTTICSGSLAGVLTLSGNVGNVVKWQSSVSPFGTWTDIVNTTTTYNPGALTQTTQFRAVVLSGSCVQAISSVTTVTVSPTSVGGTVTGGTTICTGSTSAVLTLSGYTGTVVKWQSSVSPFSTWTDIANTLPTYTSDVLNQTTQFRAVVQSGSCATANSAATTVTISAATVGGAVSGGTTICFGNTSGVLSLSGQVGTILKWQSSVSPFSTWTDIANTTATYTSAALTQTTQFRAVVQSGSCPEVNSASATVTVTPTVGIPVFTMGSTSNRCMGAGTVTYGATATDAQGYTYSLDAASLAGGNSINAGTGTVTFAAGWSGISIITISAAGCNGPKIATHTVTVTSPPTATINYNGLICSNELTHPVVLTGTAGGIFSSTAGLTIDSSSGAIVPATSTPGSYTVLYTIAASGGCNSFTTSTQVLINSAPVLDNIVIKNITCNGSNDGALTAKVSGNGVFTYLWTGPLSFSSNNANISGLAPGDYTLKVTNSIGCSTTTTVTIIEPAPLSLSFVGTNPSKSGASDGKIDAIITGGTGILKYSWTGGTVPLIPNDSTAIIHLKFGKYFLTVTDNNGNGCSKKDSYTLFAPPTAVDDRAGTIENKPGDPVIPTTFNVLKNDTAYGGATIDSTMVDLDPQSLGIQTVFVVDKKGAYSVTPNGDVTFRPLPGFYGIDTIQYVVSDNNGLVSNIANIIVTVKNTKLPPVAVNDNYTISEHGQKIGNVIKENDVDPEGQPLTLISFKGNGSPDCLAGKSLLINNVGTVVINADGKFNFTPLGNFFGVVPPIDYVISDMEGLRDTATINITVTPVNDPPVAVDDNFTGKENTKVEGNVLRPNPTNPDTDPKGLTLTTDTIPVRSPAHGKVVLAPNGDFSYQPVIDFLGTDSFIYQICNSATPSLCSTATVTIVIAKDDSCNVFVPSVFSPNGDGIHDYFQVRCLYNYDNPEMQIYNRNGNLIFKKNHYGNLDFWGSEDQAFWNGRSQNKMNVINDELPVGTYYYILKLGNGKVLTGFIFLAK
jgi:gliding motility-associated-like protein